jgi:hypothetical protein
MRHAVLGAGGVGGLVGRCARTDRASGDLARASWPPAFGDKEQDPVPRSYVPKGNLHTHKNVSDGLAMMLVKNTPERAYEG